jgi:carbamoyl-phosphate synthase large subunit
MDADIAIHMTRIDDHNYMSFLKSVCLEHNIETIISLNDLELPILAKHKSEFEHDNIKIIISNEDVIKISFDKWKTYNFLLANNFNTPVTYIHLEKVLSDLESGRLYFPLIIKPRWGSASINVEIVEDKKELLLAYQLQKIKNSRTIPSKSFSEQQINESIVIQEKIIGKEYGMDILNDFNGAYFGSYAREKLLMRSGETDRAKSVIIEELTQVGSELGVCLKHVGNLDCDVFFDGSKVYVLELNPRIGGGYPFSHEAGINTVAIYLEWVKGNTDVARFNNYKSNITFSKCDRLIQIN